MDLPFAATAQVLPSLRSQLVEWADHGPGGYVAESLAVLELAASVYFSTSFQGFPFLRRDPAKPQWGDRDLLFWGIPEAFPALSLCLRQDGFLKEGRERNPESGFFPGVESPWNAGPYALAMAYGAARRLAREKSDRRGVVFLDETALLYGAAWEAALAMGHDRLGRWTVVVAHSGLAKVEPLAAKWEAFGWKVFPVRDGHSLPLIVEVLERTREEPRRPQVILASTVLGHGVPFMEGKDVYRSTRFSSIEQQSVHHALAEFSLTSMSS